MSDGRDQRAVHLAKKADRPNTWALQAQPAWAQLQPGGALAPQCNFQFTHVCVSAYNSAVAHGHHAVHQHTDCSHAQHLRGVRDKRVTFACRMQPQAPVLVSMLHVMGTGWLEAAVPGAVLQWASANADKAAALQHMVRHVLVSNVAYRARGAFAGRCISPSA